MTKLKIAYVVSDLKRVGPTNQTLNIIKNSKYKESSIVITLFKEDKNDTMISEYKKNGIKIECLNLNRVTFLFSGKKKLLKELKKYKIDIVHSYGVKPDCLCNKICSSNKISHIITLRNYPKEDILTRMNFFKGIIALHYHLNALLKCKNVVCCSKTICEKMKNDYPQKNWYYIQNGIDIEKFRKIDKNEKEKLREKYNFDKDRIIFISTGSFIPRKRIEETILGFIKSESNGILLLLGEGFLLNELKEKYSFYKNIIFYGKVPQIEKFLQLSDFFVSSSESEGLPNGVIEALATSLPVVLSDIPQHKEILDQIKDAGITYKLGNIDEMSKAINNIYIYKNNNINVRNSPFTMYNMSKKYIDFYEKIRGE